MSADPPIGAFPGRLWGTVARASGSVAEIAGLGRIARLGDRIAVAGPGRPAVPGEIVGIARERAIALLAAVPEGLAAGTRAYLEPAPPIRPGDGWLGCVVDADGRLADGRPAPQGPGSVALRAPPPEGRRRRGLGPRLATGLAVTDTLLPLCRGQRVGLFAGSGVGKSRLLARLARGVEADVTVIGLIGERGREIGEFVSTAVGPEAMARAVVVTASSDRGALAKRRAGLLSLAVAEHFRDRGRHVLLLLDSLTRVAEAHREIALATGEAPALRGFPPSTSGEIAALCERAGPGGPGQGDITAVFTVLVAGSDMEEPIADLVRGTLDGHVVLDRAIAERGRHPAIDLRRSVSRAAPECWSDGEAALAARARRLVAAYEDAVPMIQSGLYQTGGDPVLDEAVDRWPALDAFLAEGTPRGDGQAGFADLARALDGGRDHGRA